MENGNKRQASRRKYHYIYKTTCIITNKFYIGMHSTDNLEDGYIGSGKRLWYSIKKYGRENHKVEILEFLPNRDLLAIKEREIVNREFIKDPMCMNLMEGGSGGFISKEQQAKRSSAGGKAGKIKIEYLKREDPEWYEKMRTNTSKGLKKVIEEGTFSPPSFKDRFHSKETKMKMSLTKKQNKSQSNERNSQYGSCWITNGIDNKKINKGDLIPDGWRLGRFIK
jgi:hypothetical protein